MADQRVIPAGFYVYTHARPDGSVFYVGKGSGRRAWDFSPKRRTLHHRNIAMKYGLRNIIVTVTCYATEDEAFAKEREAIEDFRSIGVRLINLTDGGEGTSGRQISPKVRDAFAKARGRAFYEKGLSEDAKRNILDGLARGRKNAQAWRRSPDGIAHILSLAAKSAAATAKMPLHEMTCEWCAAPFSTKYPARAHFCSKGCGQRARRDLEKKDRDGS